MQTERAKTKELADDRCLCICWMQRNQFNKQKAIYDGCGYTARTSYGISTGKVPMAMQDIH